VFYFVFPTASHSSIIYYVLIVPFYTVISALFNVLNTNNLFTVQIHLNQFAVILYFFIVFVYVFYII